VMDMTFFESNPLRGVAVGGSIAELVGQTAPGFALAYTTTDGGGHWNPVVLDMTPLQDVILLKVRFIDANTAYAIGWAGPGFQLSGSATPVLVKITIP